MGKDNTGETLLGFIDGFKYVTPRNPYELACNDIADKILNHLNSSNSYLNDIIEKAFRAGIEYEQSTTTYAKTNLNLNKSIQELQRFLVYDERDDKCLMCKRYIDKTCQGKVNADLCMDYDFPLIMPLLKENETISRIQNGLTVCEYTAGSGVTHEVSKIMSLIYGLKTSNILFHICGNDYDQISEIIRDLTLNDEYKKMIDDKLEIHISNRNIGIEYLIDCIKHQTDDNFTMSLASHDLKRVMIILDMKTTMKNVLETLYENGSNLSLDSYTVKRKYNEINRTCKELGIRIIGLNQVRI